ncbi:MAG: hypothetical protein AMJ81_06055 [Phycisphaerae bacterium SM23_33]|nr:MAG: hypothetical protein AMJ81_06055 [Phycisphaerae bacterium SM23_33]
MAGAALAAGGVRPAGAVVVTERWGISRPAAGESSRPAAPCIQHPDTLVYELLPGEAGLLMRFDLSALPDKVKIYRARLFFPPREAYGPGYDVAAAHRLGDGQLRPAGRLKLIEPHCLWLDATAPVAAALTGPEKLALFLIREAPAFDKSAAFLEVAYEGRLKTRLKQVGDVKAFCRGGQVFITFGEIEDLASGRQDLPWGEFAERVAGWSVQGPISDDRRRELRYRVYRHDRRITPANIGQAELLGEVPGGTGYNTRLVPPKGEWEKKKPPVLRLAVEPGKPLPPGVGLYVQLAPAGAPARDRRRPQGHQVRSAVVLAVGRSAAGPPADAV